MQVRVRRGKDEIKGRLWAEPGTAGVYQRGGDHGRLPGDMGTFSPARPSVAW